MKKLGIFKRLGKKSVATLGIGVLVAFGLYLFHFNGLHLREQYLGYKIEKKLEKAYSKDFVVEDTYYIADKNVYGVFLIDPDYSGYDSIFFDAQYDGTTGKLVDSYVSQYAKLTLYEKIVPSVGGLLAGTSYDIRVNVPTELVTGSGYGDIIGYDEISEEAKKKSEIHVVVNSKSKEVSRADLKKLARTLKDGVLDSGILVFDVINIDKTNNKTYEMTLDLSKLEKGFTDEEFDRVYNERETTRNF